MKSTLFLAITHCLNVKTIRSASDKLNILKLNKIRIDLLTATGDWSVNAANCSSIFWERHRLAVLSKTGMTENRKLLLFDVDGTLTEPRKIISKDMLDFLLNEVCLKTEVALVGGSDLNKISEQMGGHEVISKIPFVFSENGLVALKYGKEFSKMSIQHHIGEETLQKFINFSLAYMSKLILPVKRGTFIEFRSGLINVSPIGRGCSQEERDQFEEYDKKYKIREKFIESLKKEFPDIGLIYSIGGQISFDVFPKGWDKTFCLNHIKSSNYEEIHFFGDKTEEGGNDYELYNSPLVVGHKVTSPSDTMNQLKSLLCLK